MLLLVFCLLRQLLLSTTGPTMVQELLVRTCNLIWLARLTRDSTIRLLCKQYIHIYILVFFSLYSHSVQEWRSSQTLEASVTSDAGSVWAQFDLRGFKVNKTIL